MVRRADFDSIDIIAAENVAEISRGLAALVRAVFAVSRIGLFNQAPGRLAAAELALPVTGALAVDVAHSDDLHALVSQKRVDVVEALVASADHGQVDAIAGRDGAREPERSAGYERGKGESRGGSWQCFEQEVAAGRSLGVALHG